MLHTIVLLRNYFSNDWKPNQYSLKANTFAPTLSTRPRRVNKTHPIKFRSDFLLHPRVGCGPCKCFKKYKAQKKHLTLMSPKDKEPLPLLTKEPLSALAKQHPMLCNSALTCTPTISHKNNMLTYSTAKIGVDKCQFYSPFHSVICTIILFRDIFFLFTLK